jgi:flagellar basal body-associated protein FliL
MPEAEIEIKTKEIEEIKTKEKLEENPPEEKKEDKGEEKTGKKEEKKKIKLKIPKGVTKIGLYIVILGLSAGLAYFLAFNVVKPALAKRAMSSPPPAPEENETPLTAEEEVGKVFVVENLIVNPAGTNGTRFLNTTVGFGIKSEKELKILEEKSSQIRDRLITIFSGKTLAELSNPSQKELLRKEILLKSNEITSPVKVLGIYFVDFVIQ